MRLHVIAIISVVVVSTSGCAYLTTYTQPVNLKSGSVSIDAKQRVVFSQERKTFARPEPTIVVCAEPSPDALTVLGVSGGVSASGVDKLINASGSLAETGGYVGLRTQSIQLLRDAMYRLCEGFAAGAVSEDDFAAMQRRYQSTMLGLIAIEQLTRPVVAGQMLLTSSATAQAGATSGDSAVDKAQERAETAKSASLDAQKALDEANTKADKAAKDVRDLEDKIAAAKAKKEPDQDQIDALTGQRPDLQKADTDARLAQADARRRATSADESVRSTAAAVRAAQAKVSASASGGGALGAIAASAADSTEHLTKGVYNIVEEVNRSYTKDACLVLMIELTRNASVAQQVMDAKTQKELQGPPALIGRSIDSCERILAVEATRSEQRSLK